MMVNISKLLQLFFWLKLVPVRRKSGNDDCSQDVRIRPNNTAHVNQRVFITASGPRHQDKAGDNEDQEYRYCNRRNRSNISPSCWEWDCLSLRFWLLMMFLMAAIAVYIYFAVNRFCQGKKDLYSITILVYKLLNMTPTVIIPWTIAPAFIKLGQRALPPELVISAKDLAKWLVAPSLVTLGLALIHVHSVMEQPWGSLPVGLLSALNCAAYNGQMCFLFGWLHNFCQEAGKVGQQETIMAREAEFILAHFEQIKSACSDILFSFLLLCQVIQIFSSFNILFCK
jgi:hypothetical protein